MKIVIAGAGDVGFHLAKLLAGQSHDITLIDTNAAKLTYASAHLDIFTIQGDATSYRTLKEAKAHKADLLIAVTSSQAVNIAITIFGKKIGARQTIARIENTEYMLDNDTIPLEELGIDEIISPESLAANEIKRLLRDSAVTDSFDFAEGKLSMIGIHISEDAPIIGKSLIELAKMYPDRKFVIGVLHRNSKAIIPRGQTVIERFDYVYFVTTGNGRKQVYELTGKQEVEIKNVMILGGSRTGFHAARILGKKMNVKLVEIDEDKCLQLANDLPNVMIIHADGRNVEALEEEGLDHMDAFVAVTGNSETNILSCLVAKSHKAVKTIALVENIDYINLSMQMGLDAMINKKLIAANFIFRYLRKGEVLSLAGMHGVAAETMEYEVKENSRVTQKPIKEIHWPKNALIGGLVRGGQPVIPKGDTQILAGDRVVVFSLPDCINKIDDLFK